MNDYIESQWPPEEMQKRRQKAIEYSRCVRQLRRGRSHHMTKLVWKLLAISFLLFSWAVVLALLVGARGQFL